MPLLSAIVTHVFSSECRASVCVRVCSSLFFSRGVAYEGVYTNELGGEGSSSGGGCGGMVAVVVVVVVVVVVCSVYDVCTKVVTLQRLHNFFLQSLSFVERSPRPAAAVVGFHPFYALGLRQGVLRRRRRFGCAEPSNCRMCWGGCGGGGGGGGNFFFSVGVCFASFSLIPIFFALALSVSLSGVFCFFRR